MIKTLELSLHVSKFCKIKKYNSTDSMDLINQRQLKLLIFVKEAEVW